MQAKMMHYDPIFAKSFTQTEQRKFGHCAVLICLVFAFSFWIATQSRRHVGDTVNLQVSVDDSDHLVMREDTTMASPPSTSTQEVVPEAALGIKEVEPICRILEPSSDYCDIRGDVRIQGNSSTIYVVVSSGTRILSGNETWIIQPYVRKKNRGAMGRVKKWTVKLVSDGGAEAAPACSVVDRKPGILFSSGGYSGNHFHDLADLVIPLYTTSKHFNGEVQFLATDYKPWWMSKFRGLLRNLSRYEAIDIDRDEEVHCFSTLIAGLKPHKELTINPSESQTRLTIHDFRQFLRRIYSLERTKAIRFKKGGVDKPRLMIISRKKTRLLMNELQIAKMAKKLGYEVVMAEANLSTDLSKFSQLVNSCDVIMGVHGAGLANMVFLPENAVLIQVIPLGAMEKLARRDFGEPAEQMNIRYLEYKIAIKESSLIQDYPLDHMVFRDPQEFHRQGWEAVKSTFLDKQNVRIDLRRFRGTLVKALKLLRQ